jgi:tetratricopeptide (TPR) repeat protein
MPDTIHDLYKLFEVAPTCSNEELRRSYRRLLLRYHPDLNPGSIETAATTTRHLLAAYGCLSEWRRAHPTSTPELNQEWERKAAKVVIETPTGAQITFSAITEHDAFRVSLGRIAELKQELRDAWREFGARQYDIKSALRLVRAAFQGGRPDVVDSLLTNAKLVDAAPILADMYSADEAAQIARIWGHHLCDSQQFDLAIQMLQDLLAVAGMSSLMVTELRDDLRSIHYGIAQGHFPDQKPSPATRILHLSAILKLGFELGYIYKLLAEAFYEIGDEDKARANLQCGLAIDPQLSGAKTIMRALGLISEEPRRKSERIKHLYTRPEQVPSVAAIVGWFEHDQWEQIIAHADPAQYSPRILPSARWSLGAIASVLGECNDCRALPILRTLLNSVYWDVRQNALLALAKTGGELELAELRQIRQARGENDKSVVESVAYAEARLSGAVRPVNDKDVVPAAEELLRTYSHKKYAELGRMRWRLEQAIEHSGDARSTAALPLLAASCLQMHDWTRVLKLLGGSSLPTRIGGPQPLELHIDVAAALVRGAVQSAALACLHPIYEQLSRQAQRRADAVLWDALNTFDFIGSAHYTWALGLVLKDAVFAKNPDDLLRGLHRLARIMEPIGEREMAVWLRHTLREGAPGYYYGDSHDRLNYFRPPVCDVDFVKEVKQMCEEYKPKITERLRAVLGGEGAIQGSISGLSE